MRETGPPSSSGSVLPLQRPAELEDQKDTPSCKEANDGKRLICLERKTWAKLGRAAGRVQEKHGIPREMAVPTLASPSFHDAASINPMCALLWT
jgi:hypothetical protein